MKKKVIMILFTTVYLLTCGALLSQSLAVVIKYGCIVPYNIKSGNWNTGIHIFTDQENEFFYIHFKSDDGYLKSVYLDMDEAEHPYGWTGTIDALFSLPEYIWVDKNTPEASYVGSASDHPIIPEPVTNDVPVDPPVFKSPSCIIIYSTYGRFTVTQFITNAVTGFGFQTFYSWPFSMGWPYVDTTPLSEPFSKPMCGEGDGADLD